MIEPTNYLTIGTMKMNFLAQKWKSTKTSYILTFLVHFMIVSML